MFFSPCSSPDQRSKPHYIPFLFLIPGYMWWECECSSWSGIVGGRCACGAKHCSARMYLPREWRVQRSAAGWNCVCVSLAVGEICMCTASLAEGGVFKELVMLNRCVCSTRPYTWGLSSLSVSTNSYRVGTSWFALCQPFQHAREWEEGNPPQMGPVQCTTGKSIQTLSGVAQRQGAQQLKGYEFYSLPVFLFLAYLFSWFYSVVLKQLFS